METGEPTFYHSYSVDLTDENSIRSLIVDMIGSDKRVLVVGIARAGITSILKEHNNTVQEIEIHSETCLIVEESCEYFISIDGKQVNLTEFLTKSLFDIILLTDILVHLKNPSDLLKNLKQFLNPQGTIIVSLPNYCNGNVLYNLLNGEFHYPSKGVFDKPHFCFIGLKKILSFFSDNGFQITDFKPLHLDLGHIEQKENILNSSDILKNLLEPIPYSTAYQFIFRITPSDDVKNPDFLDYNFNDAFNQCIENYSKYRISEKLKEKNFQILNLENEISQLKMTISYQMTDIFDALIIDRVCSCLTNQRLLYYRFLGWGRTKLSQIRKTHSWRDRPVSNGLTNVSCSYDTKIPLKDHVVSSPTASIGSLPTIAIQDIYAAYQPVDRNIEYEHENCLTIPDNSIKLIAFYLPQFHPFPENDRFWGKGFTEWTNTTKALPFFPGHSQPRLPGELGFYDTRLKEVLKRQIELAKTHGIFGFCLYHYWFQGKPVMRVPYEQILNNEDLDIPFCLCWANEPWTARFDGLSTLGDVLIPQIHSGDDDIAFFRDIEKALKDKRYIHVDGKPLLIIYRPSLFPDIKQTVNLWRNLAKNAGIGDLFLVLVQNTFDDIIDPRQLGFDAAIEFPPQKFLLKDVKSEIDLYDPDIQCTIYDYSELITQSLKREKPPYTLFRGICSGWDCTPRRKNPLIIVGSSPPEYQKWLEGLCQYTRNSLPEEHRFIFINAWNEWTEGAYLEPDRKFGYGYLNSTSRALINSDLRIAVVLHLFYPELADEIIRYLHNIPIPFDLYISTPSHVKTQLESTFKNALKDANVIVRGVENRGYDIAPFLLEFKNVLHEYDLVLKIHGKRSTHWKDHHVWRRYLMSNLLGSEQVVRTIFNNFTEISELGIVFPENLPILKEWLGWGDNFPIASELLKRMNIQMSDNSTFEFPAGSMYWFRPAALEPLFQLEMSYSDFDTLNKRDGSLAHAIERSIILVTKNRGFTWQKVSYYDENLNLSDKWNNLRTKKFGKIAVILHIFYPDLIDEFIVYLKNIPYTFDILVSCQPEHVEAIDKNLRQHFPESIIDVRGVDNYGYDIYPFVSVFKEIIKKYDYVCKIHSKKSEHHPEFAGWRKYLLDNLLGSQFVVNNILSRFGNNPRLGLIFPENYPPTVKFIEWGSNYDIAQNLLKMCGIKLDHATPLIFPAGSMFWFRPVALKPLFTLPLTFQQFKVYGNESIDGTLSHAIERVILKIVEHQKYYWEVTSFYENDIR